MNFGYDFWSDNGDEMRRRKTQRGGRTTSSVKRERWCWRVEHIWHVDSSAHLSLSLPREQRRSEGAGTVDGASGIRGQDGGRGRRLTVTRGDVVRLASARVSVSEACNDDGLPRRHRQSISSLHRFNRRRRPWRRLALDNRRVASYSPSSRTPGILSRSRHFPGQICRHSLRRAFASERWFRKLAVRSGLQLLSIHGL